MRGALAYIAFQYPLYMAAQFALNALPGLIRAAVLRQPLAYFRVSPLSIAAAVSSAMPSGGSSAQNPSFGALTEIAFIVMVLVALLTIVRRKSGLLAGLAVATLGHAGLQGPTWRIFFFKILSSQALLEFLFYFAVVCLGLRWMLERAPARRYVSRSATLLAYFLVPLFLLWLAFVQIVQFRSTRFLWAMIPSAMASLLVSAWPTKQAEEKSSATSWKLIAAGVVCTVVVATGTMWGGPVLARAFREAELAKARAEMEMLPKIPENAPYEKIFFQKGVSFTAEFPAVYTSEAARTMLRQLPAYGVNAIALVPFGGVTRNPPGVRFFSTTNSWESDEGLEQLSRVAHAIGVKVMLKPQLWTRGGDWQELEIPDTAERAKWFAEYQTFIEHYAKLAARIHADLFCVGVELGKLAQYDAEWRKLIADVREIYSGPLVYAANFGAEFEDLTFWDALDYIGLDNYYPLPDDFSTDAVVRNVETVQQKFQRPVLFTEAGFSSLEGAHRRPWDEAPGKISVDEQARGYEAVLRAFYTKPWFAGVYWWKVGTNGRGGANDGSHTPWQKPAMEVVRWWYVEGKR